MIARTAAARSARPTRPARSPLVIAGIMASIGITLVSAAPAPIGIGVNPGMLLDNLARGSSILAQVFAPSFGFLSQTIRPLLETVQMAILASVIGCGIALPLAFLASRITAPNRMVLGLDRALLNLVRAIPDLLYAMIFVAAVSIGPLAGVLALIMFQHRRAREAAVRDGRCR